jgi:glycosyltransferase involved in cell wall biosynthesis
MYAKKDGVDMKISLILATLGRDLELVSFLNSLAAQTYRDFELIIIDQNRDKKIDSIVEQFINCFPINHVEVNFSGIAKARDYGIQFAIGEIIAFPDDDCVYEVDVLGKVVGEFESRKAISILAGGAYDFGKTKFSIGTHSHKSGKFSRFKMMGIEFTHFFNLSRINKKELYLDHDFGIGAKYFSMEGFELLYRLMRAGNKAFYTPGIRVYHANRKMEDYTAGGDRIFKSSFAMGAFIRKFTNESDVLMIYYILRKMFIAPVLKVMLAVFLLNPKRLSYSFNNLIRIWQGFFAYRK